MGLPLFYLSRQRHISGTIFHFLLTRHQIIHFANQPWLFQHPQFQQFQSHDTISEWIKPPVCHLMSKLQTCLMRSENLDLATLRGCYTFRWSQEPKWSPVKDFGWSEICSRSNTFIRWVIQEVLHLIQKVLQVRRRKEKVMPFSAVIPWNSSLIFCLRQYLQRVNLGEVSRWPWCSQICEHPWKHSPINSYS